MQMFSGKFWERFEDRNLIEHLKTTDFYVLIIDLGSNFKTLSLSDLVSNDGVREMAFRKFRRVKRWYWENSCPSAEGQESPKSLRKTFSMVRMILKVQLISIRSTYSVPNNQHFELKLLSSKISKRQIYLPIWLAGQRSLSLSYISRVINLI